MTQYLSSDDIRSYAIILGGLKVVSGPIYKGQDGEWRFTLTDRVVSDVAEPSDVVKFIHY